MEGITHTLPQQIEVDIRINIMKNYTKKNCKALNKENTPCHNYSMKNSDYCYVHSFGKFKGITWYKNSTYHFVITILLSIAFVIYGPSLVNQNKMLGNDKVTHNKLDEIEKIIIESQQESNIVLLNSLKVEIESNFELYSNLKLNINDYITGKYVHYVEYNISSFQEIKKSNALRYDSYLFDDINDLYTLFNMANTIFKEARSENIDKKQRNRLYTQIFDDHSGNIQAWEKIIHDLIEYINNYASIDDLISKQTNDNGAFFGIYVDPFQSKLMISNFSSERSIDNKLEIKFEPPEISPITSEYSTHSEGITTSFDLPEPVDKSSTLFGIISFRFKSKSSDKTQTMTARIVWNKDNKRWEN